MTVRASPGLTALWAFALTGLLVGCKSSRSGSARISQAVSCSSLIAAATSGKVATATDGSPVRSVGLRRQMRDMYECRMLQLDDVKRCRLLEPDVRSNCIALYTFWHAARNAGPHADWPKILADAMHFDCTNSFDGVPASACDQLVKAISATKPALCPTSPAPLKQMCSAVAAADPGLCEGDKDCAELAGRLAILKRGGGIKSVAREGTRRDQIHAHATLGDKDACKPEMDAFRKSCVSSGGRP